MIEELKEIKISKIPLTLKQQRDSFEKEWGEVFFDCLNGEVDQSKILSAMYNLNQVDFEIIENERQRRKKVQEEFEEILNKKRNEAIEFHRKRGFDIVEYYQSQGIEF